MRISTQNIACSQRQMYTCIHHSVIHYEHTTCNYGSRTYLINSTPVLEEKQEKQRKTKTKAVKAYLIKNSKGEGGGGERDRELELEL